MPARGVLIGVTARGKRWAHLIGLLCMLGAMGYIAVCSYMALKLTRGARQPFSHFPEQFGLAYESVSFPSRVDGLRLDGWLLLPADGVATRRPVAIVHGWSRDRQSEVEGHVLEVAAHLVRQGRPVLLFDLRGWGRSAGYRFTLGAREVRDVGGAIDFLDRRGLAADGVDLLGYSMGAATSMLAASADLRVRALVEDSGYSELVGLLNVELPKASGLPGFFTPGTLLMTRLLVGADVYAIRPIDGLHGIATRGIPLLVIHGEADALVPVDHGHRLAAAYGPHAETLFVPGAEHANSYNVDPATYLARLSDFFDRAEQGGVA